MNPKRILVVACCVGLLSSLSHAWGQEYVIYGSAVTYRNSEARAAFPGSWDQHGHNQRHNPVFSVPPNAPGFLTNGTYTVSPLTGDEFRRVEKAQKYFPADGNLSWGSTLSQWVGNVKGVSVAQGIVYAQTSRREIYALDAQTSLAIWRKELVGVAGMGQTLVREIGGQLRVFVPVGDADFSVASSMRALQGKAHHRGGGYGAIYCLDGLTGAQIWRFDTLGASRPTPIYRDGLLYAANGDGHLYILNAGSGALVAKFANPGLGQVGLAAPNWYQTADGRLLILYGTTHPRSIIAVDVTNPSAPSLAWRHDPAGAAANAAGDTSVAVDPDAGIVVTSVFTNTAAGFDLRVLALDATTGAQRWSQFAGTGPTLSGFKGGNPMIHEGAVYLGNPLNATVQSYDLGSGALRWSTAVPSPNPAIRVAPRAAPVMVEGKLIFPVSQHILTFDPATGALLNDFYAPYPYVAFGINQPVVIGRQIYLSSTSGYVFGLPLDAVTRGQAPPDIAFPPLEAKTPEYYNAGNLPSRSQAEAFPNSWLAYAGNPAHNNYSAQGPTNVKRWTASLPDALSLAGAPLGTALYGEELAHLMTYISYGVGAGVSAARGIVYVAGGNRLVSAFNAYNGKLIWRFRTLNHHLSQPIVTPNAVIVAGGNTTMNLGNNGRFLARASTTRVGTGFMYLHALDRNTGTEKWTFYAGQGALGSTPLYHNNVLYWVDGQGTVWAIDADSGQPRAPFMDASGFPLLNLGGGFNAQSSANLYQTPTGQSLMIVGMSMPNRVVAIDLTTAQVVWSQPILDVMGHITGYSASSPVVDQTNGRVIGSALVDVDIVQNRAHLAVYALDAATGQPIWLQRLDPGPPAEGLVAATPMLAGGRVYIGNPPAGQVVALDAATGALAWKTAAAAGVLDSRYAWGPGVRVGDRLVQPLGRALYTLDANTGAVLRRTAIGGGFAHNYPLVLGTTLYIGNAFGWIHAYPLSELGAM